MIYYQAKKAAEILHSRVGKFPHNVICGELFTTNEMKIFISPDYHLNKLFGSIFVEREIPTRKVRHVFGRRVEIN